MPAISGKDSTVNYKGYLGNQNLKGRNVEVEWTAELVKEYQKCASDPFYFCDNYYKIITTDEGTVPFEMFDYQANMLESFTDNRYTIITTARQAGKSTIVCAYLLWYVLFTPDKTVALLANKGETARELLKRIQDAYQHLPAWLQQGIEEWNKGRLDLENGSRIIAAATSSSGIRGFAINLLFIDEAAHVEGWDEFFTSVYPTISSGKSTKIILVSTPLGMNHFYKLWTDAEEKRNDYNPIKVMWYDVPGRDQEWKRQTLAGMDHPEKFPQEHECVTGDTEITIKDSDGSTSVVTVEQLELMLDS